MRRRKAIGAILIGGGGLAAAAGGYEWYSLKRRPDLAYLQSKKELLTDLAETIIPATDTPGAREAGAIHFLIPLLTECTPRQTLNRFISGMEDLEKYADAVYKKPFSACSAADREAILDHFEAGNADNGGLISKVKRHFIGESFIITLKHYVTESYCISEKGATLGLAYLPVPGKNQPCLPLEPNQKAWATK